MSKGISRRGFLGGAAGMVSVAGRVEAETRHQGPPPGDGVSRRAVALRVNGVRHQLDLEPRSTLAQVIRRELALTGTKVACDRASCGACTVLLDGRAIFSCHMLAVQADGRDVETIEHLARDGELHPIQSAFIRHDAAQCGFCTPGMIMTLKGLLDTSPLATPEEIQGALAGNICRCGAYNHILDAAVDAAEQMGRAGRE